jgi:hypothetical protein
VWTLRGGGDEPQRSRDEFRRLARRAIFALGERLTNPDEAVDAWLDRVFEFRKGMNTLSTWDNWRLKRILEGSAEYSAELATRFHEAGNLDAERTFGELERQFRQSPDPPADLRAIRRNEIHAPDFSASTKRKFDVQWEAIRESQRVTDEDIAECDRERQRHLGMPANPPSHVRTLRPHVAARDLGFAASISAAQVYFRAIEPEYWKRWCSTETAYERYESWLEVVADEVSGRLASIWKKGSAATHLWFKTTCGPAIENAVAALAKQRITQARKVELSNIERKQRAETVVNSQESRKSQTDRAPVAEPCQNESSRPKATLPAPDHKEKPPDPASWGELEIFIPNDLEAQIVLQGRSPRTLGFEEMGLADSRGKTGKKANKLWRLLLKFARLKGRIESANEAGLPASEWKTVEQRVWALNAALKQHFGIPGSPIRFIKGGYESMFKIKANPLSDL